MTAPRDGAGGGASGPGGTSPGPSPFPPGAASGAGLLPEELTAAAATVFGDRLPMAIRYAELLTSDGVERGLIGPREGPRLWERHLLNCAVIAELIPLGCSVVDVGSGAGLPGIVLAVARPDLTVVLVEPLARRIAFLAEVVTTLGLASTVTVVRGRAEDLVGNVAQALPIPADVVTARAVAPLDRLAGWCLPLTAVGGRLLALKGATAADEVAEHRAEVARLGGATPVVRQCGDGVLAAPTTVVEIVRERAVVPARSQPARSAKGRDARSGPERGTGRGRTRRG
ncbi:MAG TPA: 16S rRNA (guanine(527)-N(7))-methyltransferase RsmG [Catenuloplanes sp.]